MRLLQQLVSVLYKRLIPPISPIIGSGFGGVSLISETRCLYPDQPYMKSVEDIPPDGLNGLCPVCGGGGVFKNFTENLRESGICSICGSTNRQRQIAFLIRRRFLLNPHGKLSLPDNFNIYNTESTGAVHSRLSAHGNYIFSEYFGDQYSGGEMINGIRHENLQNLSFADESFDLVLSSDVFEHFPSPYRGHQELFRVLKPGGIHIFTVPFDPYLERDQERARFVNGEIEYLEEKLFHGDPVRPNEGILVWTIFGLEMMQKLEEIGFNAQAWSLYEPRSGIIGANQIIFEAMKPL